MKADIGGDLAQRLKERDELKKLLRRMCNAVVTGKKELGDATIAAGMYLDGLRVRELPHG